MEQLFSNYILICAVCAWMVCQVFKILLYGFRLHQWNIRYLWAAGGMPSSHSASAVALATAVGLHEGFSSGLFAACAVFAFVVMYDAAGVRRETGKQGQIINEIMRQLIYESYGIGEQNLLTVRKLSCPGRRVERRKKPVFGKHV